MKASSQPKAPSQPSPTGRAGSSRSATAGRLSYLSERQTRAYLLARDTIRRTQRSASFFDAPSDASNPVHAQAQGQRKDH